MSKYTFAQVVRTDPIPVYHAEDACVVHVWAPLIRKDGKENPPCYCEVKSDKPITTKEGLSLGDTIIIPFRVEEGETFWAWSTGEGLINLSVIPD